VPARLTEAYSEFAAAPGARAPQAAIELARLGFTDCAGVMLAGRREEIVTRLARLVSGRAARGEARILFSAARTAPDAAALVGAAAAHALDFDDYAFSNHPSAVLVPAVLAAAEASGADGARMARAYAVGYEIWADLMLREPDHLHSKGWHPTAVFGPIAAAAATAAAMGFDARQARNALALAASLSGGVMENFGTMAKPYHGGRAAEAGLTAAVLAAAGVEASATAIEGERGLLHALSPTGRADRDSAPRLGEDWRIARLRLNIKKYPTVGASQRVIDAILALRRDRPIDPDSVRRIVPRVSTKHAAVMPFHRPQTALEAKFSLEFAAACALLHGAVGLAQLTDGMVRSAPLQALMARVEIETTTDFDPDYPGAARFDVVRLVLDDGSRIDSPAIKRASGHADAPLTQAALREMFLDCARHGAVAPDYAESLFAAMQRIDALRGAGDVPALDGAPVLLAAS
jgi:2-methylcitrate dehydratase PrpD